MKRKSRDMLLNGVTYFASFLGVLMLGMILIYVFTTGFSSINLDMLKNDYWSKNYLVAPSTSEANTFTCDSCDSELFSSKWGIALQDDVTSHKEEVIVVTYVDPNSPLKDMAILTAGDTQGNLVNLENGFQIEKIEYIDASTNNITLAGKILKQDAATVIQALDNATSINSVYMKTTGGGIRGSLITTLYLILISLLLALPIGILSAVYLHEYAKKTRLNSLIRRGIEALTGIPSIVYGLMGVSVLFPVTQLFGASTTSILLGSLTMAIILLPTIIRSTEEALIVVPDSLRSASLSLGATQSQTVFKVVLPCCVDGILTGVLLGIGRVIGESAALIYTMGTFINDNPVINGQGTSLSLMIWSFMSGEQPNFELACAVSIIILIVVLSLNIIVKFIGKKVSKQFA